MFLKIKCIHGTNWKYYCEQQQQQQQVPLASAAVWGASNHPSSHWASEGAWGNPQNKANLGFWDEVVNSSSNKKTSMNK